MFGKRQDSAERRRHKRDGRRRTNFHSVEESSISVGRLFVFDSVNRRGKPLRSRTGFRLAIVRPRTIASWSVRQENAGYPFNRFAVLRIDRCRVCRRAQRPGKAADDRWSRRIPVYLLSSRHDVQTGVGVSAAGCPAAGLLGVVLYRHGDDLDRLCGSCSLSLQMQQRRNGDRRSVRRASQCGGFRNAADYQDLRRSCGIPRRHADRRQSPHHDDDRQRASRAQPGCWRRGRCARC